MRKHFQYQKKKQFRQHRERFVFVAKTSTKTRSNSKKSSKSNTSKKRKNEKFASIFKRNSYVVPVLSIDRRQKRTTRVVFLSKIKCLIFQRFICSITNVDLKSSIIEQIRGMRDMFCATNMVQSMGGEGQYRINEPVTVGLRLEARTEDAKTKEARAVREAKRDPIY